MKKITKNQVKSILKNLKDNEKTKVLFTTSKTYLSGYKNWIRPIEIELSNDLEEFERIVNEFTYDNCNAENGNNVHYYLREIY